MNMVADRGRSRLATLLLGLLVLDIGLTFQNVWPTPAVRWTGGISVELGVCLLVLAAVAVRLGRVPRWLTTVLAGVGVLLVLGRYAVVTSPALFGRDVNLYWDLRFIPDVVAMLAEPASWTLSLAVVLAAVAVPYLLFRILRWALAQVAAALALPRRRIALTVLGLVIVGLFVVQRSTQPTDEWEGYSDYTIGGVLDFPPPVTATYANQFRILRRQLSGAAAAGLAAGPDLDASLDRLAGVDVFIFFVESYGAVAYDKPEFRAELEPIREQLAQTITAGGRRVVSAFVESPTFGGGSWLAHISLMTGLEVRDEDTNQVLLTQDRDSLVTSFSRRGYRTVAMMPGLQRDWPEGGFYKFDTIYGEPRLEYQGPQFGWWVVPDQFSLARLDELEFDTPGRAPVFAFMAGVSTHTPFSPTAPYQPDWSRLMTRFPYTPASIDEAYEHQPDWFNLGPSYSRAMKYVYESIGGYLRKQGQRDFVFIVLGDHQPPALVTGLGAPWDVPVHVIASRPSVLASLEAAGFTPGLEPRRPSRMKMHALTPVLLRAFSGD